MKSFATKSRTVLLFGLLLAVFRAPSQLPDVGKAVNQAAGAVKKAAEDFFSDVKNRTIAGAGQIDQWRRDAAAAAQKKATDFASCPSPDAQRLYDELKGKRDQAQATRNQAAQAVADADAALANCLRTWPDGPGGVPASPCRATYGGLPFKGIRDAAQAAVDSLNAAMNALKALKCITGCDAYLNIVYPSCLTEVVNAIGKGGQAAMGVAAAASMEIAGAASGGEALRGTSASRGIRAASRRTGTRGTASSRPA